MDEKFQESQMTFFESRNSSWTLMPGYEAMLAAFDCSKQAMKDCGPDQMAQVEVGIGIVFIDILSILFSSSMPWTSPRSGPSAQR
jgi:hypothetical protein